MIVGNEDVGGILMGDPDSRRAARFLREMWTAADSLGQG
jgi:hypothetical protein